MNVNALVSIQDCCAEQILLPMLGKDIADYLVCDEHVYGKMAKS